MDRLEALFLESSCQYCPRFREIFGSSALQDKRLTIASGLEYITSLSGGTSLLLFGRQMLCKS